MTPKRRKAVQRAPEPPQFTILDVMEDEALLGRHFEGPSWSVWKVFLKSMFVLSMSKAEREVFSKFTQREYRNATAAEISHAVLICGRRSGKSRILALIGIYLAIFRDWSKYLSPGEPGTVLILAASKDQAAVIYRYAAGMLREVPMFERLIKKSTAGVITLTNGIEIKVTAASFRTTRGMTAVGILADETAFWWSDPNSAESDVEIWRALRPSILTVPGARTLIASSPYRREGLLWNEHRRLYGQDVKGELCWLAATRDMNSTVPQAEIDAELQKDYEAAKSEYLAIFRDDLEAFLSRDVLEPIIMRGVREIPPQAGVQYIGSFDGAGGEKKGGDSATCAITHYDHGVKHGILDAVRETVPPFSPSVVVAQYAALFKQYRITRVFSDRWARGVMIELFAAHGITLVPSEKTASDYLGELLPAITSQIVSILDNERLISQFMQLERRTSRSGKDNIGHPTSGNFHDDLAVAAAIALVSAKSRMPMVISPDVMRQAHQPGQYSFGRAQSAASVPAIVEMLIRQKAGRW